MRQRPRHGVLLSWTAAVAGWLLLAAQVVSAQEADSPRPAPKADEQAPAQTPPKTPDQQPLPGERLPNVFYLPDKTGELQAVLGMGLEEFFEIYDLKNQLDEQTRQPSFSLQEVTLTGSAAGQRAELNAKLSVLVHKSGWVRVPLGLGDAILREPAAFDPPGEHFLDRTPDGDSYTAWIRGESGKTYDVSLRLWAEVTPLGSESHLRLRVPRATLSRLDLQVPVAKAVARVSEGSTLESVEPTAGGKSRLGVVGLAGEFDLAWHAADSQVASLPTVLEAVGAVMIRVNGRNINSDAKLTVRSVGGEFDHFQVRLPPDAEYVPTPQVEATITPVEGKANSGRRYEVKLAKKTTGPVDVRFVTRSTSSPQRSDEAMELAGFEVIGAVRQWGTIAVQVDGNWQVAWGDSRNVRQVEDLPGIVALDDLAAAFEYSDQPYSLTARVRQQETWVRAEGDYVVLVGADEARLQAKLKYSIRGAKVSSLEVDVPGWDVDLILPANVVNVDAVAVGQNSPLVIPLLQPTSGELEITFEGRQKISPQAGAVSLRVPVPHGESIAPANVTVLPEDNVELLLEPDATEDLSTQSVHPKTPDLPQRQQDPLYLRTSGETPTLVASVVVHDQAISAAVAAQAAIDERETRVEQRMTFQIDYQPTDRLTLGVPRAIRADALSITLDGQRLVPMPIRERSEPDASGVVPLMLELPAPRIGRCELLIEYVVPHEKLASQANTLVGVPLVIPGEGELTANELTIVPDQGVSVKYPKGPWTEDARTRRPAAPAGLTLLATRAIPEVALAVSFKQRHVEQATTIEQAWIQTRLTSAQRFERAIYRLVSSQPRLRVSLPEGAELASLELEVDGRRVKPELDLQGDARDLLVPVSAAGNGSHLLELRYRFAERPPRGQLSLESPRIEPAGWVHQLYWQLVLPADEHVLGAPASFVREYRWAWSELFLFRQPSLGERELESWIGAAPSPASARLSGETDEAYAARQAARTTSENHYLYSSFGAAQPLGVYTLGRAWMVLVASLPLLLGGLLLIYVPAARHPATLLVAAVAVGIATLVDPESTLLLAQAASLGLVLAAIAFVLARVLLRPTVSTVPVRGSSRALERSYTEAYVRPPTGSQPSTATNPLVSTSVPESQS